jgi:ABC-type antimicrobial peptide transport system permease subunit
LIAQSVTERTREFGIRLALGSSVPRVITVAAAPGIALTMAGVVMGCALARAAANLFRASLWGVEPNDAVTLWGVSATLVVIALVASLVPCLRIARIDPAHALRDQ